MDVKLASIDMADTITDLLINRFSELNSQLGYDKYKTDKNKILNKIKERLSTNSDGFSYFVIADENGFKGFVNCLIGNGIAEIVALELVPEFENDDNAFALLSYAMGYFKDNHISNVITEVSSKQNAYFNALKRLGASHIESKFNINL